MLVNLSLFKMEGSVSAMSWGKSEFHAGDGSLSKRLIIAYLCLKTCNKYEEGTGGGAKGRWLATQGSVLSHL
jgi:hypothetical protein